MALAPKSTATTATALRQHWDAVFFPMTRDEDMIAAVAHAAAHGFKPEDVTQIQFVCSRPELEPSLWFGDWHKPGATYWIVSPLGVCEYKGGA